MSMFERGLCLFGEQNPFIPGISKIFSCNVNIFMSLEYVKGRGWRSGDLWHVGIFAVALNSV